MGTTLQTFGGASSYPRKEMFSNNFLSVLEEINLMGTLCLMQGSLLELIQTKMISHKGKAMEEWTDSSFCTLLRFMKQWDGSMADTE